MYVRMIGAKRIASSASRGSERIRVLSSPLVANRCIDISRSIEAACVQARRNAFAARLSGRTTTRPSSENTS